MAHTLVIKNEGINKLPDVLKNGGDFLRLKSILWFQVARSLKADNMRAWRKPGQEIDQFTQLK